MTVDHSIGATAADTGRDAPRLNLQGISKSFGAVRAIRSGEITIRAGRVHALVGENGAGKSTMIKIISGVEQADSGTIEFEGAPDMVNLEYMWFEDLGDGRTRLRGRSICPTTEARDALLSSGMEDGMVQSYERLEAVLTTL